MAGKRTRRVGSIKAELVKKSRESALSAVQVFNNPLIEFKSESFIVLMVISWTYLLHAYYRGKGIEYRYLEKKPGRRKYQQTAYGAYKHWELSQCVSDRRCPLDKDTVNNLKFLIGLRNEVEHQMCVSLDDDMSSRYQACVMNYCYYLPHLFGQSYSMTDQLGFSIQFSAISKEQVTGSRTDGKLPRNVQSYITKFDENLSDTEFNSDRFAYRVFLVKKTVNSKGQADSAIEFVNPGSDAAKSMEAAYWAIKDRERPKYLPGTICKMMQVEGYPNFKIHNHTELWKKLDGQNPSKGYGVVVEGKWYWYENWIEVVRKHCEDMGMVYK